MASTACRAAAPGNESAGTVPRSVVELPPRTEDREHVADAPSGLRARRCVVGPVDGQATADVVQMSEFVAFVCFAIDFNDSAIVFIRPGIDVLETEYVLSLIVSAESVNLSQ